MPLQAVRPLTTGFVAWQIIAIYCLSITTFTLLSVTSNSYYERIIRYHNEVRGELIKALQNNGLSKLKARKFLARYKGEEWGATIGTAKTYSVVLDAFDDFDPGAF